ncbi:creatininase family protein [Phenylobacterium sp. LjRoot225]|uniref:creatininase family protein n=1 Tax=Phenylobacterium sp. LjRoot225 TaxID=3342285 RepID=UPI003ED0064B
MTRWTSVRSPEIAARIASGRTVAVLPVGATEQHGPHLPSGVDTLLVESISAAACERQDVLMLPPLAYGCSHGHTGRWAGTLSLSPRLLATLVEEIATWAVRAGVDRLLIVSGHATNGPSIESAILQLRHDLPQARFATRGLWELSPEALRLYTMDGSDVHANLAETAMLLALRPDEVDMTLARDVEDVTIGKLWRYDMPAVTANGVVGRPSQATAEFGREMYERLVSDLAALLAAAEAEAWPGPPS